MCKKFNCIDIKYSFPAKDRGARRLLIVSGSGEKKKVNSLTCLQHLQSINADRNSLGIDLGVAYNPYFPIECDRGNESLRLAEKLETGLVSDIWLQFGSDVTLLRQSLELLYDPAGSFNISGRGVKMIGSLFLPSKAMLARMRFRPWNGVFLSPEYLNDLTVARQTTQSILDIYREFNVEPLIETSIKNSTELEILMDLMDGNLAVWPRTTTQDHIISAHDGDKELDCTMESSHDEAQIRRGRRRFAVEMDAGGAGGADEGCSMVVARTKRRKKSDASNQKC